MKRKPRTPITPSPRKQTAEHGRLVNRTTGRILAGEATVARRFLARFWGWMGRGPVRPGVALGIASCDWVHTFFVASPLDLVYCDRAGRVLRVAVRLSPNRIGPRVPGAWMVWEMASGQTPPPVAPGDIVAVVSGR